MNYTEARKELKAMDDKWVTINKGESEESTGRKVKLDDNGNIIGGDLPKSMQGKPIS